MSLNILVTSIGSFAAAAVIGSLNKDERVGEVYGCDIYPKEWHHISKCFKEVFRAPYVSNPTEYLDFILKIIESKKINLIIPLTDIEVDFFNKHASSFKSVLVTIGSPEFLKVARDKELLSEFLLANNFKVPRTFSFDNIPEAQFPLIGKPKNGRSSEGILMLTSLADLTLGRDYSNYIFQEYIKGDIVTIDVVRNATTKEIVLIPRKELLRTKNGAGTTVELFYDKKIVELAARISENLNAHGAFNMEFIRAKTSDFLIDVNPRFSAGIGFTNLIGYNIVKNMINVFMDETIDRTVAYKNIIAQKHMVDVVNITLK